MASASTKVIITCAITGGIHTPTMSEALPYRSEDIAREAIAAAEAGAAILHLHARDPKDGRPSPHPDDFMKFLPRIKQATDAVINITTGGGMGMTVEQRLAGALAARPEMCSPNMGSMNFGIFPLADRYKKWKFDWEEPYLRSTDDFIFRNTFRDIETILRRLGDEHGARFEHECYDVGHLYNVAHFVDRGLLKPLLCSDDFWNIGRHRRRDGQSALHEKDRRQTVRRQVSMVRPGGRSPSDGLLHPGRDAWRKRSRRARRQPFYRQGKAGGLEQRTGPQDPAHSGGTWI